MLHFNEQINRLYLNNNLQGCRNITFQVTEDCCLKCSYCYQTHKTPKMMSKDIAKQAVDLLFRMYDEDKPDSYINKTTHGLVLDFIGGEPFMNVEIMDFILEYFLDTCIRKNHEWLCNFRVSLTSNGVLYFEPKVQNFLKKYGNFISLTITVDGPKEIHDACRVDANGNGSFEKAFAAMKHYDEHYQSDGQLNTKITIAPENLHNLNTIFDFFVENGATMIYANCIYEHKWTIDQAKLYYEELKKIADKLLLNPQVSCSRFFEFNYQPKFTTDVQNWCGGDGSMLAFDPDGVAYPCVRYMKSSLGCAQEPLVIGDVNGIYITSESKALKEELNSVDRRSQSTDECFYCPIAAGCSWCTAYNYQETGSVKQRSTNICWMHRAESLANVYYQNKKLILEGREKIFPMFLPAEYALKIISEKEYDTLLTLSSRRDVYGFNDRK